MNKKGLVVLVVIAAILAVLGFLSLTAEKEEVQVSETASDFMKFEKSFNFGNGNSNSNLRKTKGDFIAVIYIEGVIGTENKTYNQEWILNTIKELKENSKNKGILLFIDSPGGTVYESDETYLALMDYKKSSGKSVYAYFGSMAASGGYYIGCAADKIFANRNCLTGSIGVIAGSSLDATELMSKIGIKSKTFHAGRNKTMLSLSEPLTQEQEEIMQSVADEAYEQFTGIVADSRHMKLSDVKELADGRVYTAKQAKANGLIDEICSTAEAEDLIKKDFEGSVEFMDYKYNYTASFMELLSGAASFITNPAAEAENIAAKANAPKLNYLAK